MKRNTACKMIIAALILAMTGSGVGTVLASESAGSYETSSEQEYVSEQATSYENSSEQEHVSEQETSFENENDPENGREENDGMDASSSSYDGSDESMSSETEEDPAEADGGDEEIRIPDVVEESADQGNRESSSAYGEEQETLQETASDGNGDETDAQVPGKIPDQASETPEPAPGTVLRAECPGFSYSPVFDGAEENTDNEDLFAGYVNQELGLEGDLQSDTGSMEGSDPRKNSNNAVRQLAGYNRPIYGVLLEEIRKIAGGKRTSSLIPVPLTKIGLGKIYWTAKDLGVRSLVDEGGISETALNAAVDSIGIDLQAISQALLLDCPYEMYWCDKETGYWYENLYFYALYDGTQWSLHLEDTLTFGFYVAREYSASGKKGTTNVKTGIGTSVQKAAGNARQIAADADKMGDIEKLDYYRWQIQNLTDYNYDAAYDSSMAYGNPWQLIWVFDGDPKTKVVCEGYSKAFQYLCDLSAFHDGIVRDCICVTGTISGGPHMWNLVLLTDGRSYLADLTNCGEGAVDPDAEHALFLVGVRPSGNSSRSLATGSVAKGYSFAASAITYKYDSYALKDWPKTTLTLAEGRVTSATKSASSSTAVKSSQARHSHVYITDPRVEPTCARSGLTAGSHCAICGQVKTPQKTIPGVAHKGSTWTVKTKPTYTATGVKTTKCVVCGHTLTATIPRLVRVSSVSVSPASAKVYKGKTVTLKAAVLPTNAANRKITWQSYNTYIATVTQNGVVKGVKKGTVTIAAKARDGSGRKATCKITVLQPVTKLTINKTSTSIKKGNTTTLKVEVYPASADNQALTWTSSDKKIATVSQKGVVKGLKKGTVTITAAAKDGSGKKVTCKVKVK